MLNNLKETVTVTGSKVQFVDLSDRVNVEICQTCVLSLVLQTMSIEVNIKTVRMKIERMGIHTEKSMSLLL